MTEKNQIPINSYKLYCALCTYVLRIVGRFLNYTNDKMTRKLYNQSTFLLEHVFKSNRPRHEYFLVCTTQAKGKRQPIFIVLNVNQRNLVVLCRVKKRTNTLALVKSILICCCLLPLFLCKHLFIQAQCERNGIASGK